MPNNEMEPWEKKFWQITEEKGLGANLDFPLALRDMFREQLILARREEIEIASNTVMVLKMKSLSKYHHIYKEILDLLSPTSITRNEEMQ